MPSKTKDPERYVAQKLVQRVGVHLWGSYHDLWATVNAEIGGLYEEEYEALKTELDKLREVAEAISHVRRNMT